MSGLRFFDANAVIGEPVYSGESGRFSGYVDAADLLREMDRCGVERALVYHWDAVQAHPNVGNARLAGAVAGHERLHPCWVVLPHHTGESPEPERLLVEMRAAGVRAVRLLPDHFRFSLEDWSAGPLLAALERQGVPAIIEASPEQLRSVCLRHPRLAVIATGGEPRRLYPLLGALPNLRLSLEGGSHAGLVEDVCRRFGAERLLFGGHHVAPLFPTGSGRYEPGAWTVGAAMAMVAYAAVPWEERRRVAGGNLRSLLGLDGEPALSPPSASAVIRHARAGERLPLRLLDAHYHPGPWTFTHHPGWSIDSTLAMMDAIGVERLCLSSGAAVAGGDHYEGNRQTAAACRQHPDRLIGFGVINPHFPDTGEEIRRCIEDHGFRGLKVHPRTHQCELGAAAYTPVWEASQRYGVLVQAHTGERQTGASPRAFDAIAAAYPQGAFHLVHSGDNIEGLRLCLDLAERHPNLYLGTSDVAFMYRGMLEYAVRRVGAARLLFESDATTIDFAHSLGIVLYAGIPDEAKALILGGNLAALLSL